MKLSEAQRRALVGMHRNRESYWCQHWRFGRPTLRSLVLRGLLRHEQNLNRYVLTRAGLIVVALLRELEGSR